MRILIVDDYPTFALTLRILLGAGHATSIAASGEEALALLRAGPPFDLVLYDLTMSGVSGADFHAIVAREQPDLVPRLVFMSGGAWSDEAEAFLARVHPTLLRKPFPPAELLDLVKSFEPEPP